MDHSFIVHKILVLISSVPSLFGHFYYFPFCSLNLLSNIVQQEGIPVGCVPTAAGAATRCHYQGGGSASRGSAQPPWMQTPLEADLSWRQTPLEADPTLEADPPGGRPSGN